MAVSLHSDYTEVFKFPQSGWFSLFEEVLEFRHTEAKRGRFYRVTYVGTNKWDHLTVRLVEVD